MMRINSDSDFIDCDKIEYCKDYFTAFYNLGKFINDVALHKIKINGDKIREDKKTLLKQLLMEQLIDYSDYNN